YWMAMAFTTPVPREAVEYYDGKVHAGEKEQRPEFKIGRASGRERGEISVGLEFRRVLFRSPPRGRWPSPRRFRGKRWSITTGRFTPVRRSSAPNLRSEERRVGKEGRSRWDWSSDVCSSDLLLEGDGLHPAGSAGSGGVLRREGSRR